jgi:hypothetical protein
MRDLPRDTYFVAESHQRGFGHLGAGQKLQRYGLVENQVGSPIYFAHPAFAD